MQLLSVVIITFNEEAHIERCILSVKGIADEVIVLDSLSTDKTVDIAQSYGAIVKQEKFKGYTEQKNLALSFASHNFILSLDADEALDETLRNEILRTKNSDNGKAYSMNRCTNYCGKFIRHGQWYPDKKIRLFDRRHAKWTGIDIHEQIEFSEKTDIIHLKGDILHYSYSSIEQHILKSNNFSTIAAGSLFRRGKRIHWMKLLINPFWSFIHAYFIRLGLLDGFYGFVIAIISSHYSFLKYSKLYHLQRKANLEIS